MTTPYDYTGPALYAIDKISEGYTKTAACDEANIPVGTFDNYLRKNDTLQELYDTAFQRGTDAMADALVLIDRDERYGHSDPKMAKVVSDNIKWLLAKRRPKDFGDKIKVEHTITADKAITEALFAGRQRALQGPGDDVIDVTPTAVELVEVVEEEDWSFMD